jgi:hypothetical protein
MAIRLLLVAVSVLAVVYGCGQASSPAERHERAAGAQEAAAESATPSAEGTTTVGPVFAKVDLEPVGDSATRATAVFKEVGDLGVQVELAASGLPKPGAEYFSQIHEGSCAGVQGQEEEEEEGGDHRHEHDGDHDHQHGGVGPAVALIRLNSILAEAPEQANGGHDHSGAPADELPGNIDYPLVFSSSTDGGAFVGTLLEGVAPEEVVSGKPKYIDVHPSDSEDSRTLSCADLSDAN